MKKFATLLLLFILVGCSAKSQFSNDEIILFNAGIQSNPTISSDINIQSGNLGGLSGADTICQNSIPAAALALRHGSGRAFLSAAATTEIRDMPSNWNIPTNVPIKSVTGVTIAQSWQNIVDPSIVSRIDSTLANAGVITNGANWWSGSGLGGALTSPCLAWTTASIVVTGTVGVPTATDSTWINSATNTCDTTTNNLLCLAFSSTIEPQVITLFDGGAISSGNLGGRSGADALCVAAKPTNVTQPSVRAFISVSAADDIADMPTNYGISNVLNIRGATGLTIASNWADMLDGTIELSLDGADILVANQTWASGSGSDGTATATTCSGWTSAAVATFNIGDSDLTSSSWITGAAGSCITGASARLLCVAW